MADSLSPAMLGGQRVDEAVQHPQLLLHGADDWLTKSYHSAELFEKGICEKNNQIPDSEDFMVLIDGEEVTSEISEINTNLIKVTLHFGSNAKFIEIIQTCLV